MFSYYLNAVDRKAIKPTFLTTAEVTAEVSHVAFGQHARHELFSLDDQILFLNHGSYGTVPNVVMQVRGIARPRHGSVPRLHDRI